MRINKNIFRMYDVRGKAAHDLTPDVVIALGKAIGSKLITLHEKAIVVGRDVRLSSFRLRNNLIEGLLSTGIDVLDIGEVPTPVMYYMVYENDIPNGVEITGSHNPKDYNGFKIVFQRGSVYGDGIQEILKIIEHAKFEKGKGKLKRVNVIEQYIDFIKSKIGTLEGFNVAVDPGNGAACVLLKPLFKKVHLNATFINIEPDGNFPAHLPDPTVPEYMKDLSNMVKNGDFDVGIGYDGDADRVGVVDENGRLLFGDRIFGIIAGEFLKDNQGERIIIDVKSSKGLIEYIERLGGKPYMYRTGHSLIKAKMKEIGIKMAGEMSGHIFIGDELKGYDDAVYSSLRILRRMKREGKKLSSLANEIPAYISTPEIRIPCADDIKFDVVKRISEKFKGYGEMINIDGVRVNFPHGWGLLRASNTQPVLVLRFEAETEKSLEDIKALFDRFLKEVERCK